MSLIEWKEEFSVGVAEVDLEHRDLIDLINDLHSLMGDASMHSARYSPRSPRTSR